MDQIETTSRARLDETSSNGLLSKGASLAPSENHPSNEAAQTIGNELNFTSESGSSESVQDSSGTIEEDENSNQNKCMVVSFMLAIFVQTCLQINSAIYLAIFVSRRYHEGKFTFGQIAVLISMDALGATLTSGCTP